MRAAPRRAGRRVRRLGAVGVAAVVAVAAVGCGGGPAREPRLPQGSPTRPLFGFNDNAVRLGQLSPAADAALAARAGAQVLRLTLDWRTVERIPGKLDFSQYAPIYRALVTRGVRPLWTVAFAPAWAWDPGVACTGDCRFPPSAAALSRWQALIAAIALRFPRSAGIEVWNEPNLVTFWRPAPDPGRYVRLLGSARRAIDASGSKVPLVGGALSNRQQTDSGGMAMAQFLRRMYQVGAQRTMDALSFHPYPASRDAPVFARSVLQVLDERRRAGDTGTPLWVDELGASTGGSDPALRWSPRAQADALADAYERLRRVPGVRMVLFHTLIEPPAPPGSPEAGYGLVRADGSTKPAFCALLRAVRRDRSCPRRLAR